MKKANTSLKFDGAYSVYSSDPNMYLNVMLPVFSARNVNLIAAASYVLNPEIAVRSLSPGVPLFPEFQPRLLLGSLATERDPEVIARASIDAAFGANSPRT